MFRTTLIRKTLSRTTNRRAALLAVTAALGAALLAECGGNDGSNSHNGHDTASTPTSSAQPGATFNDVDVALATGMIPHHAQAVAMSDLAATRAANPEVKALAVTIKQAQAPEITQMTAWLKAWGKPVPATTGGHDGHDEHGDSMPGMMTAEEMAKLKAASGAAFDRMFVDMMIRHHEGAITMANKEKAEGVNPEAKKLAESIATSQAAEIATMRNLLDKL